MLSDCRHLNRLTGNRGRLHSAHWLASSLKLAARCPVSGCWPSCYSQEQRGRIQVLLVGGAHGSELETFDLRRWEHYYDVRGRAAAGKFSL